MLILKAERGHMLVEVDGKIFHVITKYRADYVHDAYFLAQYTPPQYRIRNTEMLKHKTITTELCGNWKYMILPEHLPFI